jgi:hypothetical protein
MKQLIAAVVVVVLSPAWTWSADWHRPRTEDVRTQAFVWLAASGADAASRAKAERLWSDLPSQASEDDLLAKLARTFALVDPNAANLVSLCSQPRGQLIVPAQAWLIQGTASPLFSANLRLLYARWLVHESLFDEAQVQLAGLKPADVVAPASLLFYQGLVNHALLNKEAGLKSLDDLLQAPDASPLRYVAVARLLREDLRDLKEDTLDHVSRRMDDIRRRLDLGRAGPNVRKVEDGVIESLDKMIKKLEEQQQQDQNSASNSVRPSSPAPDSRIAGGKGPGDVTKKDIGSGSGWGDLPPKEREEAMQQIGRELPAHYRDAVEQYFRRLAAEGSE